MFQHLSEADGQIPATTGSSNARDTRPAAQIAASDEARAVSRRRHVLDVALGLWFIAGSFIYFRQFVAQGMLFLAKLLGN